MNFKMILGVVARHSLTAVGGALVAKGYIEGDDVPNFVGAGMYFAGLGWSYVQKHQLLKRLGFGG